MRIALIQQHASDNRESNMTRNVQGRSKDFVLYADLDMELLGECSAKRHFLRGRRPDAYPL